METRLMTDPITTSRNRLDEIHTQMARLQKSIKRRGLQVNPTWADAGDLAHLVSLLTVAAEWAEQGQDQ